MDDQWNQNPNTNPAPAQDPAAGMPNPEPVVPADPGMGGTPAPVGGEAPVVTPTPEPAAPTWTPPAAPEPAAPAADPAMPAGGTDAGMGQTPAPAEGGTDNSGTGMGGTV